MDFRDNIASTMLDYSKLREAGQKQEAVARLGKACQQLLPLLPTVGHELEVILEKFARYIHCHVGHPYILAFFNCSMCEEDIKEMAAAESTERATMNSLICKRRLAFDDIIGHRTVLSD